MRQGFTLIELMVVILIIGIGATASIQSYQTSQNRIKFHLQASEVQSMFSLARSSALNASEEADAKRLILFEFDKNTVTTFIDKNGNNEYTDGETIVKKLELNSDEIEIKNYKKFESNDWTDLITDNLIVEFSPPQASCDFEDKKSTDYMLEIPLYKAGEDDPIRYIFMHKVACLAELMLSSQDT